MVRCFEGRSLPEVMERVWQEWGEEALILYTQRRRGLWGRLRRLPPVRVWAARLPSSGAGEEWKRAALRLEENLEWLTATLWGSAPKALFPEELHLLWRCGVDMETARALSPPSLACKGGLRERIAQRFTVTEGVSPRTRLAALVGPTGVGKTTTVAKIAALERFHRRRRVALVTVDVFRIGAVQQLETYARLMGLPFFVATTAEEARRCAQRAKEVADLVLVDTIGRNPRRQEHLRALGELVQAMEPQEVHLTLPANGNDADLHMAAQHFQLFRPTSLLFTKLDEAIRPGVMLNVVHRFPLPISYLTTGQEVPEDIEVATPERLAEWILSPVLEGMPSEEGHGA